MGEPIDQPARRDARHPGTDQRHGLAAEEQAIVAGAKGTQAKGPVGHVLIVGLLTKVRAWPISRYNYWRLGDSSCKHMPTQKHS